MSNPTGPWGSSPEQPDSAGNPPPSPGYGGQPPTVYPGYSQPGQPGQPGQSGGYGDAGSSGGYGSGGYGGYGGGSGGSGGSGGYGGYGGSTPPPKPRSPWLWFLGGAATAIVVMVAVGAVVLVSVGGFEGLAGDDEPSPDVADDTSSPLVPSGSDTDTPTGPDDPDTSDVPTIPDPTTDPTPDAGDFDQLIEACDGGSMTDCDQLYFTTPVDSEEEEFGSTCGLQIGETRGHCEDWAAFTRPATGSADFDARFDRLWTSCENGDMAECDDLWRETPVDSVYEAFGSTCAGRTEETSGDCEETITYLP